MVLSGIRPIVVIGNFGNPLLYYMSHNLEFAIKAVLNTIAILIAVAQLVTFCLFFFMGGISHRPMGIRGDLMLYIQVPLQIIAITALIPCLYFLVRYVFLSANVKFKATGVILALFIPLFNWLLLQYNFEFANEYSYELGRIFNISESSWILAVSILLIITIQVIFPYKATKFINNTMQYNQSLKCGTPPVGGAP